MHSSFLTLAALMLFSAAVGFLLAIPFMRRHYAQYLALERELQANEMKYQEDLRVFHRWQAKKAKKKAAKAKNAQ